MTNINPIIHQIWSIFPHLEEVTSMIGSFISLKHFQLLQWENLFSGKHNHAWFPALPLSSLFKNNCLVSFCRKSRKMAPPYRVILHNDNYNKREYVVQVLMKVIPGMTLDNAVNIMQEAHHNGLAVVIICSQVDAEEHCMQLRGNGLHSSIEPASGGC